MSQHILFIPVEGDVEWLHIPIDGPLVVRALLDERGGKGAYVDFALRVDEQDAGRLAFLATETPADVNLRAISALVFLTRTHMVITGNACFVDIDPALASVITSGDHERINP